jgi:hypothetical protein
MIALLCIRLRFHGRVVTSNLQTLGVWSRSRGTALTVEQPIHERQVLWIRAARYAEERRERRRHAYAFGHRGGPC